MFHLLDVEGSGSSRRKEPDDERHVRLAEDIYFAYRGNMHPSKRGEVHAKPSHPLKTTNAVGKSICDVKIASAKLRAYQVPSLL